MNRTFMPLLVVFILIASMAQNVAAIVVTMNSGQRFGCVIVREDSLNITVDVVSENGNRTRRILQIEDIKTIDQAVSEARLETLNPSNPEMYKTYAEELAEISLDPDARPMSMRLYHIALMLDFESMGESCLLGMIRLARNPQEEERLRATAFLHLPKTDQSVLITAKKSNERLPSNLSATMTLLRRIRTRDIRRMTENERTILRAAIGPFADSMSDEQLDATYTVQCAKCKVGTVRCSNCRNGVIAGRRKCPLCVRGKVACDLCTPLLVKSKLSDALMASIVNAEIELLKASMKTPEDQSAKTDEAEAMNVGWGQRKDAYEHCIPPLSLQTLTEFDTSKSVYRDGQWRTNSF